MTNEYGLDVYYFKDKLELLATRVHNYTPEELSRALSRFAEVAEQQI